MESFFSIFAIILFTSVATAVKNYVAVQGVLGCWTRGGRWNIKHKIKATIELGYKSGDTHTPLGIVTMDDVNYASGSYDATYFTDSFSAASQTAEQITIAHGAVYGSFHMEGHWPATVKDGKPYVKITHFCPFGNSLEPLSNPRVFEADIHSDYVASYAPSLDPFDIGMINLRAKYSGD